MVGRESKRPLGPLFLTEAKFGCQTQRIAKRDIRHPVCRGSSVDKWSASPAGAFTLLSLPLMGVYFGYFLDPDQGQTGPVSWEVAPLPPPRPVLTFKPVSVLRYSQYRPSSDAGPRSRAVLRQACVSRANTTEHNNATGREANSTPTDSARSA
jgi:hypothetical protein